MSSPLDGSIHGINYEGRWFWVQALKLLDPQENVERVVIEANNVGRFDTDAGHFDDVVVHYNASKKDENGQPLSSDYYQVKFQMRGEGLTWKNLRASSSKEGCNCILHKLKEVVQQPHPPPYRRRFTLFTTAHLDVPLRNALSNNNNSLLWETLLHYKVGEITSGWSSHLDISLDELHQILMFFRIEVGASFHREQALLNMRLRLAGYSHVEEDAFFNVYDTVVINQLKETNRTFDREKLKSILDSASIVQELVNNLEEHRYITPERTAELAAQKVEQRQKANAAAAEASRIEQEQQLTRQAQAEYFERLGGDFATIPLFKVEGRLEMVTIDAAYVQLQAARRHEEQDKQHQLKAKSHKAEQELDRNPMLSDAEKRYWRDIYAFHYRSGLELDATSSKLHDVITDHPRLAILGEPGSGKTTLLRYLTYCFATGQDFPSQGQAIQPRLPIFVRLQELTEFTHAELLDKAVPDGTTDPESLKRCFKQNIAEGKVIYLLDGLDEVSSSREAATKLLNYLAAECGTSEQDRGSRIIVTCRVANYNEERLSRDFTHYVVLGLNTGQQRSFLTNWFTARGYKQAEAETKAEALLTHLARPALARLAEVPLLLSMLAFLAEAESELPNTRAELYMHAVGLLLGWRGKQITVDPVVAAAKEVQVYQAVAPLAAHMLVTKEHGVISEVDALGFVATDLWMQLKQEAGLMVLRGREDQAPSFSPSKSVTANLYGFPHRSFEEYFAGHHLIANLEQSRVLIREHLHQAIWREPILFAFGYLSIQNPELGAELVEQVLLTQHSSDKMLPALPSDEYEELFHMDLLIALLVCNELRPSDKSTALIRKAARQALDIHLARVVEVQGGFDPLSSDITSTFARVSAGSVGNELRNLLLDHLFSKDSGLVRAEVVDLLVRMGSANESVVSVLLSKLDKELDQHVLRHLIEGLGRLSSGKDELVKELVARLQSKDSKWAKFRFDLIKALSQVTSAKTIVVEALLPVLEGNQDKHIQQMAIAALGQVAEGNEHVANILAARLQQRLDDFETTNATIKALGGLGVASTEVIKALISVVVDVDAESGPGAISIQLATNALTILATNNPEVFRTLETKVREELPNRTYLAIALCNVALTDEELQAQVLNMVEQEDDPEVQSHMIIAVSNVEAYGYAAVPLIAKVMATSNSNDVRQAAAVALMHLTRSGTDDTNLDVEVRPDAGETEQALVLTQPVKNKDAQDATRNYILQCMSKTAAPNVRQVAAYTLGVFDGDIKVVDTLATTLEQGALEQGEEEVIRVRVAAAVSLGKIGRGNMTAVNALCVGLNDVDGFVRDASATALERTGWLEDELTQSRLIALLSDPEGHVRLAALLALHRYGIPVPNFRTALIRGFGDKHFVVKEKSIALAAQLARTDQEMVDVLSGLLFSPSAEDYQKLAALQALAEAEKIEVDWLLRILKGEGDFSMRQEAANILIELDRSPTSVEQGTAKVDVAKELKELLMSMDQQARSNWPLRDKYKMVYRTLYYIVINQANVKNTG